MNLIKKCESAEFGVESRAIFRKSFLFAMILAFKINDLPFRFV